VTSETVLDVIVIGAGPAGEIAAARAVRAGLTTAVVERRWAGGELAGPIDTAAVTARRDEFVAHYDDGPQVSWVEKLPATFVRGQGRTSWPRACYRVGLRLGEPELPALLVSHHRPGFYMRVITEGRVQVGDRIVKTRTGPDALSVADANALLYPSRPRPRQAQPRDADPCPQPGLAGLVPRPAGRRRRQRRRHPGPWRRASPWSPVSPGQWLR
jgi:FAD dependent oxidoreductase/MOSC domain